jgi:N-dimethylarginine dimethylaminohydrolase
MRFLMCKPDFYAIQYEINPWMHIQTKADHGR